MIKTLSIHGVTKVAIGKVERMKLRDGGPYKVLQIDISTDDGDLLIDLYSDDNGNIEVVDH